MPQNRRTHDKKHPYQYGYAKVKARTERMHMCVRLALCFLILTACCAFMVATLNPYRKLQKMRTDLQDVQVQEMAIIEQKNAKKSELHALENDPEYLEIIARDHLNFYKPGEYVFRIEREP